MSRSPHRTSTNHNHNHNQTKPPPRYHQPQCLVSFVVIFAASFANVYLSRHFFWHLSSVAWNSPEAQVAESLGFLQAPPPWTNTSSLLESSSQQPQQQPQEEQLSPIPGSASSTQRVTTATATATADAAVEPAAVVATTEPHPNVVSTRQPPEHLPYPPPHPQSTTTSTTPPRRITLWCFLDKTNTFFFSHFPHAVQALSQCWSFFQTQHAKIRHASNHTPPTVVDCKIHSRLAGLGPMDQDWRAALITEILQCSMDTTRFNTTYLPADNVVRSFDREELPTVTQKGLRKLPFNTATRTHYLFRPDAKDSVNHTFFWHPEHAQVLRDRLYQTDWYRQNVTQQQEEPTATTTTPFVKEKQPDASSAPPVLRIGLVNRVKNRRVGNLDQIERILHHLYPEAVVSRAYMEDLTPRQQFVWWSQQSLVVSPHGAASANLLFLQAGSGLLEIFPPHYYEFGFWALSKTTRVRFYGYFPIMTNHSYVSTLHNRTKNKKKKKTKSNTRLSKQDQLVHDMYEEFKHNCIRRRLDDRHRTLVTMYPSLPHVTVLLKRAVTDWYHYQNHHPTTTTTTRTDSSTNHNVSLSSFSNEYRYVPQISHMVSWCRSAQPIPAHTIVHQFDDDPPESLRQEVAGIVSLSSSSETANGGMAVGDIP